MSANGAEPGRAGMDVAEVDPVAVDLIRAVWRKSSYSGGNGSCVEIAELGEHVAVRDSKDKAGPKLVFRQDEWRSFVQGLKMSVYGL